MKKIDPRITAILTARQNFIIPNILLSIGIGVLFYVFFCAQQSFAEIGLCIIVTAVSRLLASMMFNRYLEIKYYNGDLEAMLHDSEDALAIIGNKNNRSSHEDESHGDAVEMQLEIVNTPDVIYGRYMDTEFYEWLDVKSIDGPPIRFTFKTTEDISKGRVPEIQPGCILIPPGLVYEDLQFTSTKS